MYEKLSPRPFKLAQFGHTALLLELDFVLSYTMNASRDTHKTYLGMSDFIAKTSGQSYKHFTLVIYDSSVVIWGIFKSGTPLGS